MMNWIMALVCAGLVALSTGSAQADELDKLDKFLLGAGWSLLAVDAGQTAYIFDHPERGHREGNPVLRELGPDGVVPYFAAWGGIMYYAGKKLPSGWRKVAYVAIIAIELWAINNNIGTGVQFQLPF
jgi:hypothetical protein